MLVLIYLENFEVPSKLIRNTLETGKTWLQKMVTLLRSVTVGGRSLSLQSRFHFAKLAVLHTDSRGHPVTLGLSLEWEA